MKRGTGSRLLKYGWRENVQLRTNLTFVELTPLQTDLLECLRTLVAEKSSRRFDYRSEYLGYLPFGLYHWIIAEEEDISLMLPPDWSQSDLEVLARAGLLAKVDEWRNPDDELETKVTYEIP